MKTIVGNELVNLMAEHEQGDRYSYFYRGSNQSLDNILISKNIKDKVVFSPVHINASFMEEHGRASDHDPVVVQIDFSKKEVSTTPEPSPASNPTTEVKPVSENKPSENVASNPNQEAANSKEVKEERTEQGSKATTEQVKSEKEKINKGEDFFGKNVLPKTGLNSSSSLLFAGLSAVAAFILGRKRNKN